MPTTAIAQLLSCRLVYGCSHCRHSTSSCAIAVQCTHKLGLPAGGKCCTEFLDICASNDSGGCPIAQVLCVFAKLDFPQCFSPRKPSLQALRTPTVIFVSVACFTLVISILLVCRHLHRTWRGITPEEHSSSDSDAAQQDKELSRMESQLHRLTPVVVLQPDSKVGHAEAVVRGSCVTPSSGDGSIKPVCACAMLGGYSIP